MKVPNVLDTISGSVGVPADNNIKKPPMLAFRHFQCFILFLGLSAAYAQRVNLSVAIVAMTDKAGANDNFPEYSWNESIQSYLLSSFFWGYIFTQVPAGTLSQKYGGYITMLCGSTVGSIVTMLLPLCAQIGDYPLVLAARILIGFSQGFIYPSAHSCISNWSCPNERGLFTSLTYSGAQFGTFLMFSISGILSTSAMGWPSVFYFSGGSGLIFTVLYFIFGSSTPGESKWVSDVESKYIESFKFNDNENHTQHKRSAKIPWKSIFTSPAFLVILLAHCCYNFGFWTLLTEIPTYMKYVLGQDIKSNALLSALPYFVMFLMCFVFSFISRVLDRYQLFSLSFSRKFFNTVSTWIPTFTLIGLGYVGSNSLNGAIALLTVSVGITGAGYLGFQCNHMDIAPNFAGILMGITNCAANIVSIIAPLVVGLIVTDNANVSQWRIVFYTAGVIYFIGNLLFVLYGKTDVESWNDQEHKPSDSQKQNLTTLEEQK